MRKISRVLLIILIAVFCSAGGGFAEEVHKISDVTSQGNLAPSLQIGKDDFKADVNQLFRKTIFRFRSGVVLPSIPMSYFNPVPRISAAESLAPQYYNILTSTARDAVDVTLKTAFLLEDRNVLIVVSDNIEEIGRVSYHDNKLTQIVINERLFDDETLLLRGLEWICMHRYAKFFPKFSYFQELILGGGVDAAVDLLDLEKGNGNISGEEYRQLLWQTYEMRISREYCLNEFRFGKAINILQLMMEATRKAVAEYDAEFCLQPSGYIARSDISGASRFSFTDDFDFRIWLQDDAFEKMPKMNVCANIHKNIQSLLGSLGLEFVYLDKRDDLALSKTVVEVPQGPHPLTGIKDKQGEIHYFDLSMEQLRAVSTLKEGIDIRYSPPLYMTYDPRYCYLFSNSEFEHVFFENIPEASELVTHAKTIYLNNYRAVMGLYETISPDDPALSQKLGKIYEKLLVFVVSAFGRQEYLAVMDDYEKLRSGAKDPRQLLRELPAYLAMFDPARIIEHQIYQNLFGGYFVFRMKGITEAGASYLKIWRFLRTRYIHPWQMGEAKDITRDVALIKNYIEKQENSIITIDGLTASGKNTVGKALAAAIGCKHYDAGMTYRAITWLAMKKDISFDDEDRLLELIENSDLAMDNTDSGEVIIFANGENITNNLLGREVSVNVPLVARNIRVTKALFDLQKKMAKGKNVVFSGRNMGTDVFPEAQFKFHLHASLDVRVMRRFRQLSQSLSFSSQQQRKEVVMHVQSDIRTRDRRDMERPYAPFHPAEDAVLIDATDWSIDQIVMVMIEHIAEKIRKANGLDMSDSIQAEAFNLVESSI
ncbi:MAG: (d)CMP kinase [Candidatus Omnitrophota bacterium]